MYAAFGNRRCRHFEPRPRGRIALAGVASQPRLAAAQPDADRDDTRGCGRGVGGVCASYHGHTVVARRKVSAVSWTVATGRDNGDAVIVSIDDDFRDPTRRAGRDTRVSVRFLGPYMLKSAENRTAFEDSFVPTLESRSGVLVAGITRTRPVSYTFIGYCVGNLEPSAISVAEPLQASCTVSVHHDPHWTEYEAWLPQPAKGLARLGLILRSVLLRLFSRD